MAMRGLVEGECGAANPLVQWASHFSQDKSMLKTGLHHDRLAELKHRADPSEDMVNEFLGQPPAAAVVPQTFNMGALLEGLQIAEQPTLPPPSSALHRDAGVREWVEEFASHPPPLPQQGLRAPPPSDWSEEFVREQDDRTREWAQEFAPTEDEKWAAEFAHEVREGENISAVAREMSQTLTDQDLQATEFMDFVKQLGSGELQVQNDQVVGPGNSKEWAEEYSCMRSKSGGEPDLNFWDRLEREWEEVSSRQESHPWLSDYETQNPGYQFTADNPLQGVENPLEEGLKKLREGDLPSAALLFEAEVQARPDSVKGWQYLGTTQADNEQELAAIAALQKCLELEPGNLTALMALAVSYTNESRQRMALLTLKDWLRNHPKYSSIVPPDSAPPRPDVISFMTPKEHTEVMELFLRAAQLSPEQVDPDIQVGLGVLFNLSSEYDKAVDCFSAALEVRPEDAMLWNKLGATLANGSRSEEAVHAYRQALQRLPGFTRSRYNLGISCINLKAYKEAIEHFLTALSMQRQAKGPTAVPRSTAQMSESVWSTLRLAVTFHGRTDLLGKIEERDLDFLLQEFGVTVE